MKTYKCKNRQIALFNLKLYCTFLLIIPLLLNCTAKKEMIVKKDKCRDPYSDEILIDKISPKKFKIEFINYSCPDPERLTSVVDKQAISLCGSDRYQGKFEVGTAVETESHWNKGSILSIFGSTSVIGGQTYYSGKRVPTTIVKIICD